MKVPTRTAKKSAVVLLLLGVIFLLAACCMKHEWKVATCTEPKTCVKCGETEGEATGHIWVNATCEKAKYCIGCDMTAGAPLGHDWQEATCTEAKKCSVCGRTDGEPLGHEWEAATPERAKTCTTCGETEGKPLQIIYQNGLFTLSPKELGERIGEFVYGAEMYYTMDGMFCGVTSIIDWGDIEKGDTIAIILFGSKYDVMGVSEKDDKTVQSITAKFYVSDPTTITSTMVELMMACDDTLDEDTAREVGKKVVTAQMEGDISYRHNGLVYTFTQYKGDYMFLIAVA